MRQALVDEGLRLKHKGAMVSPELKKRLRSDVRVCVLTGAGVSQESGVRTFRDKDGLWQKFNPEELASMNAFLANPKLVWEWYEHRRQIIRGVQPNAGHIALAEMEKYFSDFTLVTQNVDGLHARAGQKNILEVHGNIERSFCINCEEFATSSYLETLSAGQSAVCEACGGRLRPDVVWFGEMLPEDVWMKAEAAAKNCDLFFSIGTSAAVFPAAGLPLLAKAKGAYVVEINPQPSEIAVHMDEVLRGPSAQVLPELLKFLT